MPVFSLARAAALALALAAASGAQAALLTTVDLSATAGTAWSSIQTTPVRVDFGSGYGLGTVQVSAYNGGFYQSLATPYAGENYSRSLSNGDTLNVTGESVFVLGHGSAPAGELAGVTVTFTLDSGSFSAGAVVLIRSLDWTAGGVHQYLSPGDGLAAPLADQLPTDFNFAGAVPTLLMGSDADGDLYGASVQGIGSGLAFPLAADAGAFSFRLLTTAAYGGGVALAFALPPAQVPEPAPLALWALGLAALAVVRGRRAGRA